MSALQIKSAKITTTESQQRQKMLFSKYVHLRFEFAFFFFFFFWCYSCSSWILYVEIWMFFILEDSDKSESRIVIPTKIVFKSMYYIRENKYGSIGFIAFN